MQSPNMNPSLTRQWKLDQTVDHFVKISPSVLLTAKADNIQPLALVACEKFGATLAICQVTRLKIEQLLRSQRGYVVVNFLKSKVGYPEGDSADQLSTSLAGINFLALAAALVSVTDTFSAGNALENMITTSAVDKTLVPTAYQLKDVLNVLEPRLNRAGFINEVLARKTWWMNNGRLSEAEQMYLRQYGEAFPSSEGLEKIVMALRAAYRIGQATSVTLTARSAIPWLTAFVIWCIGICPTIFSLDGYAIHSQADTPLKIVYSQDCTFDKEIRIEITNSFDSFDALTSATLVNSHNGTIGLVAGMTSVHTYAKHFLESLEFDSDLSYRALVQAIPYALYKIRNDLVPDLSGHPLLLFESLPLKVVVGNPFPREFVLAEAMKIYLSLNETVSLAKLPEGTLITDLPLVNLWLEQVKLDPKRSSYFLENVSKVVADILVLSLFHGCYDSLLVYYSSAWQKTWHRRKENRGSLSNIIQKTLQGKRCLSPLRVPVLAWTLKLLHHEIVSDLDVWGGSSFKGQVIFPKIFENQSLQEDGYLELFNIPGTLTMAKGSHRTFSLIECHPTTALAGNATIEAIPVTRSLDMFPDKKLLWQVQNLENSILVNMAWSGNTFNQKINPAGVLHYSGDAIFSGACDHAPEAIVHRPVADCWYIMPCSDPPGTYKGARGIDPISLNLTGLRIIPIKDNDGLRFMALSAFSKWNLVESPRILVNGGACIDCLIDTCRLTDCTYLIL